jgi:hypothetical protein
MQHAVAAFSNPGGIEIGEESGDAVRDRPEQVYGFLRITILFGPEAVFCRYQPGSHGMAGHELVDFVDGRTLNAPAGLKPDHLLPEVLPQSMQRFHDLQRQEPAVAPP